ncbi:MAG: phenylalanine--tRNA ligase subunit beta [Patescibacteria group bacterium]
MNISFNWLKQYVNLPDSVSAEEVAEKLKLSTVEVEGIEHAGALLGNVVVGKVVSAEKHPQADKLKLCQVSVGNERLQIVCGGSNVREGMLVALAKVGAKVKWHGEGEPITLEPAKIRNVESFGMICGASEIGLAEMFPPKDDHEIVDLTDVVAEETVGKPLAEILNLDDAILEIDNKSLSNRPDLWGHYGIAREVAVLFGKNIKDYKTKPIKPAKKSAVSLAVEIKDKNLCPRYMAVVVSGIKIGESPDWLKARLSAVGIRPINNVVDITNYVMVDLGEPMHAFDAKQLAVNNKQLTSIIVRKAEPGEFLTLLDGNKIELSVEDLVIADSEKPLALAGIMGGEYSGINDKTETIIFEAATFNASSIRKSSIRHSLRTDSSARFEKSLDPNLCNDALNKAVELLGETCRSAKVEALVDEKHFTVATGPISIEKNIFAKKLGEEIPAKQIVKILAQLGFELSDKGDKWSVKIPTWRATKDVSMAEDLVEEVARIYGYENLKSALPDMSIAPPATNNIRALEHLLRDVLVRDMRASEIYNYSFVSREQKEKMRDGAEYLELDNPLSKEKPLLRRSLLPNLLENVVKNIEYFDAIKIFEIGKIFTPELAGVRANLNGSELLPRQENYLTFVAAEKKNDKPYNSALAVLERICEELSLTFVIKKSETKSWQHPTRSGEIKIDDKVVGAIYEVEPSVSANFNLSVRTAILELNIDALDEARKEAEPLAYQKLPLFPEVTRDIAFTADKSVAHEKIISAIQGADALIKNAELFDVYEGEKISADKKSLAYRLTLAHAERTLNTSEIDEVMAKVNKALKVLGAEVRG